MNLSKNNCCSECGSSNIVSTYSRGEEACGNCGLVINHNIIETNQEWRAFNKKQIEEKSHTGPPQNNIFNENNLSTLIGLGNYDFSRNPLSLYQRKKFFHLREFNNVWYSYNSPLGKKLEKAEKEFKLISSQLELPKNVVLTAASIYKKALNREIVRGYSIKKVSLASIYAATRIRRFPRTLDEIASKTGITKIGLGRMYRVLVNELGLSIPIARPQDYVLRYGTELNLPMIVQKKAFEILDDAVNKKIHFGKDPIGLAGSALYLAAKIMGSNKTQDQIYDVTRITPTTIRNRYKDLVEKLGIKFNNESRRNNSLEDVIETPVVKY
ncbi:MAG: transcription initiation factor IIB [Nanoarchaeota archaeon]|nr:transcription initiation factor IIB [Nanoarchaeota archaeon]